MKSSKSHSPSDLSDSEKRVIGLCRDGFTDREISKQLMTSEEHVRDVIESVKRELGFLKDFELVTWVNGGGSSPKRGDPESRHALGLARLAVIDFGDGSEKNRAH